MAQDLEQLKQKYQSALNTIKQQGIRLDHMHVQDGKLFLQGEAPSEQAKNEVWNQVKAVDPKYSDLTLDLRVNPSLASSPSSFLYPVNENRRKKMTTDS